MFDEIPGDLLQWLRGFYFVANTGSIMKATKIMGRERRPSRDRSSASRRNLG